MAWMTAGLSPRGDGSWRLDPAWEPGVDAAFDPPSPPPAGRLLVRSPAGAAEVHAPCGEERLGLSQRGPEQAG